MTPETQYARIDGLYLAYQVLGEEAIKTSSSAPSLDLHSRAGLHAGEIETTEDDMAGLAVHVAARVSALAGPDEVLVSSTVRDLVFGSGVAFSNAAAAS